MPSCCTVAQDCWRVSPGHLACDLFLGTLNPKRLWDSLKGSHKRGDVQSLSLGIYTVSCTRNIWGPRVRDLGFWALWVQASERGGLWSFGMQGGRLGGFGFRDWGFLGFRA